ncbi:MAG: hypothetical protein ACE5HS_14310 [bacterium]
MTRRMTLILLCLAGRFFAELWPAAQPQLFAQPVLRKVETVEKARAGEKIWLTLKGLNFQHVNRIDSVKIGDLHTEVMSFRKESDRQLSVQILIPEDAEPGRHKIAILVSGEMFEGWLNAPSPFASAGPQMEVFMGIQLLQSGNSQSLVFEETTVGSPVSKRFRIDNIGAEPLLLNRPEIPAGFRLMGSFPEQIGSGSSAFFYIQMAAQSEGRFEGIFRFSNNDENARLFQIPLSGSVKAAAVAQSPRPVLQSVETVRVRAGAVGEITLRGSHLRAVEKVEAVQIGSMQAEVLQYTTPSDEVMRVQVRVPSEMIAGHQEVALQVSGSGFRFWLKPEGSQITDRTHENRPLPGIDVLPSASVRPQQSNPPILFHVTAPATDSVEVIWLALHGSHFLPSHRITSVEIGGREFPVHISVVESADLIRVQIHGAEKLPGGEQAFAALFQGAEFEAWLRPTREATVQLPSLENAPFGNIFETVAGRGRSLIRTVRAILPVKIAASESWWWLPIAAVALLLVAVPGTAVAIRKRGVHLNKSQQPTSSNAPVVQFKPKKNLGSQLIKESQPIKVLFELRVKPLLDVGKVKMQHQGSLIAQEKSKKIKPLKAVAKTKPKPQSADDLKRIEGIGHKISGLLQGSKIQTFAQLSATDVARLHEILKQAGITIADPASWPQQAKLAAAGKWQELDKLQAKLKGGRYVTAVS